MKIQSEKMRAILTDGPGGVENLFIGEYAKPVPEPDQILIKVRATAVNRADTLQRKGNYPPPAGASEILGLEVAGIVEQVGEEVQRWKPGDYVFGLLPGGGYAEYAVMPEQMAMAIPDNMSFTEAAAIPEVFLTAYQALRWLGDLKENETVLIHAGASGVGTAAIQLARELGARVLVTASAGKHDACLNLGAELAIDYKKDNFEQRVLEYTMHTGVDVIVDFIAAPYFNSNLNCLRTDGRLVMLALLGGVKAEQVNLGLVLRKRLQITGSTLRSRSLDYQVRLTQDFADFALKRFENASLKPVIDKVYNWEQVAEAHEFMEANKNVGKLVLEVG